MEKLIVVLDDRPFVVDKEKQELRQYNKPDNVITFLAFDKGSLEFMGKHITLPKEVFTEDLSPWAVFGMNVKGEEQSWNFFLGDERLARRLCGELPHIDIAGTDFTADWRLKELRNTKLPWESLKLEDMEVDPNGNFVCFYDTITKQEFVADQNLVEMPDNIIVIEIPRAQELDPVAVSREYGLGDTGLLLSYPLQQSLSATVKPIEDSGLAEFIAANRLRQEENQDKKRGR